jgi:hypothetical protein
VRCLRQQEFTQICSWSRRIGEYNGDMIPIPMSREHFARVALFARIPSIYPRILVNKTATCVFTVPQVPPEISRHSSPSAIRNEHLSFIIHSIPGAMNHVCIGASFTYHIPTRHMYIYMHGLASRNYDHFASLVQISNSASKRSISGKTKSTGTSVKSESASITTIIRTRETLTTRRYPKI